MNSTLRSKILNNFKIQSHELKTPLASLTAQLEDLEDGVLILDKERLKLLRGQVDRLTELTESLQDYANLRSQ